MKKHTYTVYTTAPELESINGTSAIVTCLGNGLVNLETCKGKMTEVPIRRIVRRLRNGYYTL